MKCPCFLKIIFLSVFFFFFAPKATLASDEFETSYEVRYQIRTDGRIQVTQKISLLNKLATVYATKYSLTLNSGRIENIQAKDEEGPLRLEVQQDGENTRIDLYFNQKVVGIGKKLNFILNYDHLDLTQKNGEILEVLLPKLAEPEKIDKYSLYLIAPADLGEPVFIDPEPVERRSEENFNYYRFTKNQLAAGGISATFGQFQVFDFFLSYHLANPNTFLGETEIALPPDTAYQQVFYKKIEPSPLTSRVDPDGNWLAKYRLKPNETKDISVSGKVRIFGKPQSSFLSPSSDNLQKNLKAQKFWEVDDPLIEKTAKNLRTAKAIYNFVVETLNYDFERVSQEAERRGALWALREPRKSICMEFTDLFITLARSSGIPAREINGYAYTNNPRLQPLSLIADVLHSWPEYWDESKQAWTPVDPTWGKTTGGINFFDKFDLNHFVFVIHGESSEEPFPAGSYRSKNVSGKNIEVVFGKYEQEKVPKISVEFDIPKRTFREFEIKGEILVKNESTRALYGQKVFLKPENINLLSPSNKEIYIPVLLPKAYEKISLKIKPGRWLDFSSQTLGVQINNQEFVSKIQPISFVWQILVPIVTATILVGLSIFFVIKFRLKSQNV